MHVPAAWISLASFSCIALLFILNFIFKIKNFVLIAKSIIPIGLMFTCIAIITGSIWGQPTWGTFWAWDARITSMVILSLFYIVLIFVNKLINEVTLLNQNFVIDPDISIKEILKKNDNSILDYVRFEVGEGIEKAFEDFAEEVMKSISS